MRGDDSRMQGSDQTARMPPAARWRRAGLHHLRWGPGARRPSWCRLTANKAADDHCRRPLARVVGAALARGDGESGRRAVAAPTRPAAAVEAAASGSPRVRRKEEDAVKNSPSMKERVGGAAKAYRGRIGPDSRDAAIGTTPTDSRRQHGYCRIAMTAGNRIGLGLAQDFCTRRWVCQLTQSTF